MSEPILSVEELDAGYGGDLVIHQINIRARAGEVTVIVGPNGSGKSTLMKAIAGIVPPAGGRVYLGGRPVTGLPSSKLVRAGLSYVPQVSNVFPSLTVRENLEMGGFLRREGVRRRIDELLDIFPDLGAAVKRPARTLSGGQRQMLAMARALMCEPQLLCLDEPTAGLSPKYEALMWERVTDVRQTGVAVLVIEQNTRRALSLADWAYVLANGRQQLEGTGVDLLSDPSLVELYVGASPTHLSHVEETSDT